MNIQIQASHIALTPDIEPYLLKRLAKADKFLENEKGTAAARVELSKTTAHHRTGDVFRAEINLELKGKSLFAFAEADDMKKAIDLMQAEIIREIVSFKGKRQSLVRRGAERIKNIIRGGEGE